MYFTTVLFDFDGTLLDTHQLIVRGLDRVSRMSRGTPFSDEDHGRILGKPLDEQMRMLCPRDTDFYTTLFQRWYRQNHDRFAKAYPDIEEMLKLLRAEGYRTGIVTNNSRAGLQLGLDLLGYEHYFDVIVTRDDVAACKPSPEGILKALAQLGTQPHEAIYVGDSGGDMLAARAAGVLPVLVGWTALSLEEVRQLNPAEIIESAYEVPFLMNILNTESA